MSDRQSSISWLQLALLLMTIILPMCCHADDKVVAEYVMADFKDAEGWAIRSLAGSVGGSTFKDGILTCDFGGHPGYIGIGALMPITGTPSDVTLTYESNKSGHPIVLRLIDSEGQYFQRAIADLDMDGIRSVTVSVNAMSTWFHFGGKNDGVVRPPIKLAEVIVDHDGPSTSIRLIDAKVRTRISMEQGVTFIIASRRQDDDKDTLFLEARSILPKPINARYYWRVTDLEEQPLDSGHERLVLSPGQTMTRSLTVARKGVKLCNFRLDADVPAGDLLGGAPKPLKTRPAGEPVSIPDTVMITKAIPTSVVELKHGGSTHLAPDSPFGMGIYLGQRWSTAEQEVPARIAQDIGVKWMRDEFNWGGLEPEKGNWNWERFDHSVDTATRHGISIFGLLCYWAPWAKPHTQEGIGDYCNYVRTVVGRYKDRIKYWEIWNEPNIGFWTGTTEQYAALLSAAYDAVKQADPDAKVIGCCTAGTDLRFIEKVLQCGDYDKFDILSIHPYRYPPTPEETDFIGELKKADTLIRKYGAPKPIWITEIGWPTNTGANGSSESKQAAMIARTYMQAMASGVVQKVFWYNFRNDGIDMSYNEHNFGIIRRDQSVKPAVIAFRTMTQHLEGKRFVKALNAGDGTYVYAFDGKGSRTLAAWCALGTARLTISGKATMVADLMSQRVAPQTTPSGFQVPISEYPVFIDTGKSDVNVKVDMTRATKRSGSESNVRITASPVNAGTLAVDIVSGGSLRSPADVTVRIPGYADRFTIHPGEKSHHEEYKVPSGLSLSPIRGVPLSVSVDTGMEVSAQRSRVYYVESRHAPRAVNLDMASGKWRLGAPIEIGQPGHKQVLDPGKWAGQADLSAMVWTAWDDATFYVLAKVTDDVFHQTHEGGDMWQGDSLQFALDPLHLGAKGPGDVYEIGIALTPKGPQIFSWLAPAGRKTGLIKNARLVVKRQGNLTIYQAAIPLSELAPLKPKPGKTVGFALVLNDDDGQGRKGWLEWNTGVAMEKTPYTYGDITFTK
jgi:hypothetical protein